MTIDDRTARAPATATAGLLIGSGALFLGTGLMFTGRSFWGWLGTSDYLAWERGFMIAAVVVLTGGLAVLEQLLRDAGTVIFPRLAFVTHLTGAIVVIAAEAAFISGRSLVEAQIVVFVVLACLAQTAYGVALVHSRLMAAWVGWAMILWNVGALAVRALLSPDNLYLPAIHFVAPVIVGVALIRRVGRGRSGTETGMS